MTKKLILATVFMLSITLVSCTKTPNNTTSSNDNTTTVEQNKDSKTAQENKDSKNSQAAKDSSDKKG